MSGIGSARRFRVEHVEHIARPGGRSGMEHEETADQNPGTDEPESKSVSRAKLLKIAGAAGAGIAFGGLAGGAKAWTPSARNAHLSKRTLEKGMVGGPT